MKVLCIDDNREFAAAMAQWLSPQLTRLDWIHVPTLAEGLQTLEAAQEIGQPFDVLLLDLLLPGETLGLLAIPQIRLKYPTLVILGMSGAGEYNIETLAAGATRFVVKRPGVQEVVLETLKELVPYD